MKLCGKKCINMNKDMFGCFIWCDTGQVFISFVEASKIQLVQVAYIPQLVIFVGTLWKGMYFNLIKSFEK